MEEVERREPLLEQRHRLARPEVRESEASHRNASHVGLRLEKLQLRRGVVPQIHARVRRELGTRIGVRQKQVALS